MCGRIVVYVLVMVTATNTMHSPGVLCGGRLCRLDYRDNIVCGSKITSPNEFSDSYLNILKYKSFQPGVDIGYNYPYAYGTLSNPNLHKIDLPGLKYLPMYKTPVGQKQNLWFAKPGSINQHRNFANQKIEALNGISQNMNTGVSQSISRPQPCSHANVLPVMPKSMPLNPSSYFDMNKISIDQNKKIEEQNQMQNFIHEMTKKKIMEHQNWNANDQHNIIPNSNMFYNWVFNPYSHNIHNKYIPNTYRINENNQIVDIYGNIVYQSADGYHMNKYGQLENENDFIINTKSHGYKINDFDQTFDGQSHANSDGFRVNEYGPLVDGHGHIKKINSNGFGGNELIQQLNERDHHFDGQSHIVHKNYGDYINKLGQLDDGKENIDKIISDINNIKEFGQLANEQSLNINTNSNGHQINEHGDVLDGPSHIHKNSNDYGNLVDGKEHIMEVISDDNRISEFGPIMNEQDQHLDEQSHMTHQNSDDHYIRELDQLGQENVIKTTSDGDLMNEFEHQIIGQGSYLDGPSHIIYKNSNGYYINEFGELVDGHGILINMVSNGYQIDEPGQFADEHGIITQILNDHVNGAFNVNKQNHWKDEHAHNYKDVETLSADSKSQLNEYHQLKMHDPSGGLFLEGHGNTVLGGDDDVSIIG